MGENANRALLRFHYTDGNQVEKTGRSSYQLSTHFQEKNKVPNWVLTLAVKALGIKGIFLWSNYLNIFFSAMTAISAEVLYCRRFGFEMPIRLLVSAREINQNIGWFWNWKMIFFDHYIKRNVRSYESLRCGLISMPLSREKKTIRIIDR